MLHGDYRLEEKSHEMEVVSVCQRAVDGVADFWLFIICYGFGRGGVCRMSLGNYPAAIEDLTVSIEKEDMLQASYYTRGVCLLMDNQYEKGLMDVKYAANQNDNEEITKQAQLLMAELEAAQSIEKVQLVKTAEPGEIALPEVTLPPETEQSLNE